MYVAIPQHVFDSCLSVRTSLCLPFGHKKIKSIRSHLSVIIGHEHNDSNIVYDWTGPVLTICSIVTLVKGDGALGPRVQGRSRRNAGIRGDSVARDPEDASEDS